MIKKIVLATHNRDKIKEIRSKIGDSIELLTLDDYPNMPDVVEDGTTLEENAIKKAREIFDFTGLAVLADDTGLEVDALNGAPGVYAARYAGENVTYEDNVNKLLSELKNIPGEQRAAVFRTVMVYMDEKKTLISNGKIPGYISTEKRGQKGFGYDPVFIVNSTMKTFAEMDLKEKNKISHRALAIEEMIALLKQNAIL